MLQTINGGSSRIKRCVQSLAIVAMATGVSITGQSVNAQSQAINQSTVHVVGNDRGGTIRTRLRELGQLRKAQTRVEVSGRICYSTCTMFLGLPNACISPNTTFGFHGPSNYGRAAAPATFNRASEIIARYYPLQLRDWYMTKARYSINRMHKIKGSQIIQMGVASC
jgi:hypothetical protein